MKADGSKWKGAGSSRVAKLSAPLLLVVPALVVPSLRKATRGFSLPPGRTGLSIGSAMLVAGAAVGLLLRQPLGAFGLVAPVWLLGTMGAAMVYNSAKPVSFVKPLCTGCRLLPIIVEHEELHLSGIIDEKAVWESMKMRHTAESLSLDGDPAICPFCPIPKRLSGV